MNIHIIEDEQSAAMDLAGRLKEVQPSVTIRAMLDSVDGSVEWILGNGQPDLIFMDIHLGDGTAFHIFEQVDILCPVIFCTAYDEYLLKAFSTSGIGYIVKPINNVLLKQSLDKYALLHQHYSKPSADRALERHNPKYRSIYLVHHQTKMLPVAAEQIVFFYVKNDMTYLVTQTAEYALFKNLETVERETDPLIFFRANRQYLVSYRYIREIEHCSGRKLEVIMDYNGNDPIMISKEKAGQFRQWLENR